MKGSQRLRHVLAQNVWPLALDRAHERHVVGPDLLLGPHRLELADEQAELGAQRRVGTLDARGLVAAAQAPRIERAYAALSTELTLFVSQLKPVWTKEQVGADHVALVRAIEREGPDVLREHMAQALRALQRDAR